MEDLCVWWVYVCACTLACVYMYVEARGYVGCLPQTSSMLLVFETRSEPKVCRRWLAGKFLVLGELAGLGCYIHCRVWMEVQERVNETGNPNWCPVCISEKHCHKTEPEAICKFEKSSPLCIWVLSCRKTLPCDVRRQQASRLLGCWEQRDCTHSLKRASREGTLSAIENEKPSD